MTAIRRTALGLLAVLWLLTTVSASSQVNFATLESEVLGRPLAYGVYLPPGYAASERSYPVVYLLHGSGNDETSWFTDGHAQAQLDALIDSGQIPPVIAVSPDAGLSWYVNRREPFESAFIAELLPEIDRRYRTQSERGRVLVGTSMGGYGATRYGLIYPELFAASALLSAAIYVPLPPERSAARRVNVYGDNPNGSGDFDPEVWQDLNYPNYLEAFLQQPLEHPFYIVSGDDDVLDAEKHAVTFYSKLKDAGVPAELRITQGGHDWRLWRAVFPEALTYVLSFVD